MSTKYLYLRQPVMLFLLVLPTPVVESKTIPLDNVYFLNDKIKMYNKIINEECRKRNVVFLNIMEN